MECCKGCYYNRPMTAWGDTFQACFYTLETRKDLYGSDECSGYERHEMQLEMNLGEEAQ